jgi:hypothetical protein
MISARIIDYDDGKKCICRVNWQAPISMITPHFRIARRAVSPGMAKSCGNRAFFIRNQLHFL